MVESESEMSERTEVTGGDWEAGKPEYINDDLSRSYMVKIIARQTGFSDGVGTAFGNTPKEALANGWLMAAAKEMREALENVAAALQSIHGTQRNGHCVMCLAKVRCQNLYARLLIKEALAAAKPPEVGDRT